MSFKSKFASMNGFEISWYRLFLRGSIMLVLGILFVVLIMLTPDVIILHAKEFSWLPAAAALVFLVGCFEFFDAFIAKELRDFFLNLQNGVLDIVASSLIIFSLDDTPKTVYTLISAFLIVKGVIRLIIAYEIELPNKVSLMTGAFISIVLGLAIFSMAPLREGWFLAAAMSIDIGFKGWSLIMLALWEKRQKELAKASN
jgi:uncharacterized membrane protein HdeD (DUF308 family)